MKARIKQAVICKQVSSYHLNTSLPQTHIPKAGDVGIFEVLELGKHTRLQLKDGKNHHIYPTDYIMAAFGTRYATSQIEGYVPTQVLNEYHILGQGGVIGEMKSIHTRFEEKGPTRLRLVGYATNDTGQIINTQYYQQREVNFTGIKPANAQIILSIGGSMDSGKTTTAGFLCRGIAKAGKKVAFIKLTGTVYTKDTDFVLDCGADFVTDFAEFGFPSTFMYSETDILNLYQNLLNQVSTLQPDYIVIEIADGLLQRETNMLLQSKRFMQTIDKVIYSDGNSTGALSGINILKQWNIEPFAICGQFTAAPLLVEEVQQYTHIPIVTLEDLGAPSILAYIKAVLPSSNSPKKVHSLSKAV